MSDPRTLIDFRLNDQFGGVHAAADYRGAIVVVVGSDRAGSRYVPQWLDAVRDGLAGEPGWERVRALGVADVRGVPSFLRPVVAGLLQRMPGPGVLLDWEGAFARAYDFVAGECNVVVADATGLVVLQVSGRDVDPARAALVVQRLRVLLRDGGSGRGDRGGVHEGTPPA